MEALINQLVKALGWSILHSLWQGAIVYALLFILMTALSKTSAKAKHNIALAGLGLIFICFCYTFSAMFEWPSQAASHQTVAFNQLALQQLYMSKPSFMTMAEAYFPVLSVIYIIGISFQLTVLGVSYFKLKKLKEEQISIIPSSWNNIFTETLKTLGIKKPVHFFLSAKVNVPLVIGFFKPVVLFPFAMASQLEINQVEAILIHELSHIRRNDYVINLIKTVIETLMFFNPFVWLTTKLINIEREHACDDLVISTTGTPVTYAHALLKLELLKEKQTPALSLAVTGNNQHLYQRIKRITNMKTNYINVKQQALILTLAFTTIVSLAWINPSKKMETKTKMIKTTIAKHISSTIVMKADTDTTKVKVKKEHKVKIVITDKNGKEKVYNSVNELPDSLKDNFSFSFNGDSVFSSAFSYVKSPEFHLKMEKMGKEMELKMNSPEWKEKMAKIELHGKELEKKFNSPEWKEKMAKLELSSKALEKKMNTPEWKEKMAKIQLDAKELEKKFNSPEWKEKLAKIQLEGKEMEKKINSAEWKKQMEDWKKETEDIKKLRESPEYKRLREQYEKDLDKLKKQKGIKTDKAFLFTSDLATAKAAIFPHDAVEGLGISVVNSIEPLIALTKNVVEVIPSLTITPAKTLSITTTNSKPATTLTIKTTETTKQ